MVSVSVLVPCAQDMVELYLQNNLLMELTHLPAQPKLKELRLELNDLTSFKGALGLRI